MSRDAGTAHSIPQRRRLGSGLVAVALGGSIIGSLGAPLITSVSRDLHVSTNAAQWTLTIALFAGAIAGPVLGRLAGGGHRRAAILSVLVLVAVGGVLAVLPASFWVLLIGRVLQGLGIGVAAMLMSVARDHLSGQRAAYHCHAVRVWHRRQRCRLSADRSAMSVLGFGVGGVSATMPSLVLRGVPGAETASVLSINQIARSIGFSIGSALAGAILAGAAPTAGMLPSQHGYSVAALFTLPFVVVGICMVVITLRSGPRARDSST